MNIKTGTLVAALALMASASHGAVEEMEIADWWLQDATVIEAQARAEGWYKQDSAKCPTEGQKLSQNGYDPKGWYKAKVPGTVLANLVANGVYPEPTYGENNRPEVIPESLNKRDWWYQTKVKVPESFKDKTVWLNFDGINYQAEVWVNGRITGRMTGAFKRASFDLAKSGDCKAGKDISIAVRISPQPTVGTPSEHTMGTTGGPCGGVARLDGPTFGCSVGWDWLSGVRDREAGLWRKVTLSATGDAKLLDPQVVTDLPGLPKLDVATVSVKVPVRNLVEKTFEGVLTVSFDDVKVEKKVALGRYETKTVEFSPAEFTSLNVKNPKLWWPNGLGEPVLHEMKLSLAADGKASDKRSLKFGIRKFEYFTPGKKEFALSVNGVRVFMKGGNWGLDEMLKRIPRERIDNQVRLHREENFNMIRDWGGMSQSEELADACDKYGILLWEDFWQFNSIDPLNTDLYFAHVRDSVLKFRNHPSIVLWCSRNEATPPKYLDDEMRHLLMELDPTRHYQPNSGDFYGFNSGGPYDWAPPARFSRFMDDTSWRKSETFKTEIGGVSIPTIESMMAMFPKADWEGITDAWGASVMAARLGHAEDAEFFLKRSGNWRNVLDPETGFMRGRDSTGAWKTPFSPFALGHDSSRRNDFTEGNSWQWTWHVMQDPNGLVAALGGRDKALAKMLALFEQPEKTAESGFVLDATGLIGQYAHGNEPSHHVVYFFQFLGRGDRTAELVREVFDKFYLAKPDGLCGNDDCGQMSAWYLFSAMGFYPFSPCGGEYILGAPQVACAKLKVKSEEFRVVARNLSRENKYVKSVTLNGRPVKGFAISHADVASGGELVFEMDSAPAR